MKPISHDIRAARKQAEEAKFVWDAPLTLDRVQEEEEEAELFEVDEPEQEE